MNTLIDIRHDLHRHPELAYEETRTSEVVQRELAAAGVAAAVWWWSKTATLTPP